MQAKVLICISLGLLATVRAASELATEVRRCEYHYPFPLEVRVDNCITPPCNVIKGSIQYFEIDFAVDKYITSMKAMVKATTLGIITVPYELPPDVAAVCPNLMYGAYCPLYPTEDVTYLFVFPIGEYPEIGVKVEIYLVDQDGDIATCFVCDIKVVKGNSNGNGTTS
ncbi:NPC intracellular cholesterol transporter 2 homolog a [Drosophila obscura]|uniref:NPC intracellular cholesterol transporter 2 homolog a n=1 Tax=Drosophila obscura TaxID=7282 RepID=UPI001BB14BC6|nr:NPC intracellular cholesterol transporter 2 homolog a [Drosophila obscura]